MIGMNWKKSLLIAGAALAAAAVVPAMTLARTAPMDVIPPSGTVGFNPDLVPVKKVITRLKKKAAIPHKTVKKSIKLARHKAISKHKKLTAKKHTA